MKNRTIAFLLMVGCIFCTIFGGCTTRGVDSALTTDETSVTNETQEESIQRVVENFFRNYTGTRYLYESNDLTAYTVASLDDETRASIKLDSALFTPYSETREYLAETNITDSMNYVFEKADYLKFVRQLQNLTRTDFQVDYFFDVINISGDFAQVGLTENISFYYTGETTGSALAETHEVFLCRVQGEWLIFDITTDDGFDSTHKNTDFVSADAKKEFESAYETGNTSAP